MKTTRQRLIVASSIVIGLVGCAGYLMAVNRQSAPIALGSKGAASVAAFSLERDQRIQRGMERFQPWSSVRPDPLAPPGSNGQAPLVSSRSIEANAYERAASPPVSLPAAPSGPDPLAGYTYTGTVSVGDTLSALIEHRPGNEGWYVRAGEPWLNYRIVSVTDQAVTVLIEGKRRVLPKSDAMNLVPLLADAGSSGSPSKQNGAVTGEGVSGAVDGMAQALGIGTIGSMNGNLVFSTITADSVSVEMGLRVREQIDTSFNSANNSSEQSTITTVVDLNAPDANPEPSEPEVLSEPSAVP